MTSTTFDALCACRQTTLQNFKAKVLGLRHVFSTELPTENGRIVLIRDGGEDAPVVGYREDWAESSYFFVR